MHTSRSSWASGIGHKRFPSTNLPTPSSLPPTATPTSIRRARLGPVPSPLPIPTTASQNPRRHISGEDTKPTSSTLTATATTVGLIDLRRQRMGHRTAIQVRMGTLFLVRDTHRGPQTVVTSHHPLSSIHSSSSDHSNLSSSAM